MITWNDEGKRLVPPAVREDAETGKPCSFLAYDGHGDVFLIEGDARWHVGELVAPVDHIPEIAPPPAPPPPALDVRTQDRLANLEASIGTLTEIVGKLYQASQAPRSAHTDA